LAGFCNKQVKKAAGNKLPAAFWVVVISRLLGHSFLEHPVYFFIGSVTAGLTLVGCIQRLISRTLST
jgi:hypothetical protein